MTPPLDPDVRAAFVLEAQLTLAPIASNLKSRQREASELEPALADEMLRSAVAVEQTAGYLGLDDVSRLSCSIAALLNARDRGALAFCEADISLLTRAFDRLHEAVGKPERRGDLGVGAEISAIRRRLTEAARGEAVAR